MNELLSGLILGFGVALTPENIFYCFIGVLLGTFTGVLPGIGSLAAMSMLLPITYYIPSTAAIIMLAGIYYGSQYGGSIASILLNLPGSPASAVACIDGYPMTLQGRAGIALLMTTAASLVGACVGIALLVSIGPTLASAGLAFGSAEYFALMLLGLVAAGTIAHGSALKGLAMVVLGVLLGTVGTDMSTGVQRYTLGFGELFDGISLVALAMGLFGVSEVMASINQARQRSADDRKVTFRSMIPTADDLRRSIFPIWRGSALGSFLGALPGTGVTISAFMAYAVEKRVAKQPERFGKGAIEGVTAPEAANNAAAQTAFIPTLTLGIPGDVTMALLLAAMMLHGIPPGPQMISQHPDLFWGLVASFFIGNVILVILNVPLIGVWVKIVSIPYRILYPAILMFICIGVYSVNYSAFDVLTVIFFGCAGYMMRLMGFEPAPLLIGFVLGPMIEENMRRALAISRGDPWIFIERPISASFLLVTVLLIAWVAWAWHRNTRKRGEVGE